MKHACAWALPWKQLQQHSDVTNFTPPDIYWPTFETSAQIIQTRKAAVSTTLAESVPAAGNKLLRFWSEELWLRTPDTHRKQWFVAARSRSHAGLRWSAGSWTFAPSHPGQVSVAKVLLGVFGVAVVVVLIAVPTAIFLNGESEIPFKYWHWWMRLLRRTRHHGQSADKESIFSDYFWLCAVYSALRLTLPFHTFIIVYTSISLTCDLYSSAGTQVSSRFVCFSGQERGQQEIFHAAGRL